ncbi:MAG: nuclear transport factor 2 family protein [Bacteroidetes bacterium]|nr:nuclear transport factor 2 family protein [Bacteroidota bacterium]
MNQLLVLSFAFLLSFSSCTTNDNQSKKEILQTEKDFAAMAKEKGIENAFHSFADTNAVIKRGNQLVRGKESIKDYYHRQVQPGELQWEPTFVDASGELGYTYGPFTYIEKDSSGRLSETKGYFHTVWKRQKDGKWKFVWD